MSYKVRIDDKYDVKLKDGFAITEQLDETLDSGEIFFNTKRELNIEPFDKIDFYNGNTKLFSQLVNSLRTESVNPYQDNEIYGTTIQTFSATKYLEKITLPNLSITRSKTGNVKSVLHYIRLYCILYSPVYRHMIGTSPFNEFAKIIDYTSQELIDKFGSVDCPEFQWNNPTLREVLTDLMMVCDCIPILRTNDNTPRMTLSFIDFTNQNGTQINVSKLNRKVKQHDSSDYCSELTLDMKNTLSKQITRTQYFAGLRNPNGGQTNDDNYALVTDSPIYEIKTLYGIYTDDHDDYGMVQIPVVEETEYNTLRAGTNLMPNDTSTKWYHLKYKRGGNVIDGFGYKPDGALIYRTIDKIFNGVLNYGNPIKATKNRSVYFVLTYTTQSDRKMHVGKFLPSKHQIRNFDAQTSSYADPQRMSIFEYHKVNRVGNLITEIGGTYNNFNDVPNLGDKIGNLILFKRTIEFRDNCIIFNGLLTENYILQDYFTSVRAKQRSWQYVTDSDALTRYDIDKFYCEFSFSSFQYDYENIPVAYSTDWDLLSLNYILLNYGFYDYQYNYESSKKVVGIQVNIGNDVLPSYSEVYALDTTIEENGSSILITYQLPDNYGAGLYNRKIGDSYYSELYKVVDDDGSFVSLDIYYGTFMPKGDYQDWVDKNIDEKMEVIDAMPKTTLTDCEKTIALNNILVYKDNAEIVKRSLQFEFCSDSEELIVSDEFVSYPIFFTSNNFKFLLTTSKPNMINRSQLPPSNGYYDVSDRFNNVSIGGNHDNCITFEFNSSIHNVENFENSYLYICKGGTNKVFFAVKVKDHVVESATHYELKFYLNILRTRDKKRYR